MGLGGLAYTAMGILTSNYAKPSNACAQYPAQRQTQIHVHRPRRVKTMALMLHDAHQYGNGTCLFTRDGTVFSFPSHRQAGAHLRHRLESPDASGVFCSPPRMFPLRPRRANPRRLASVLI